ncbi:hypothetical protein DE4585_00250 [Mycobacteroides salmoniphilum]|uniref:Uncharacterized protein n=1 Tax=Mycobacteroides salmoniphilum TaxID=404941 RepID=A0A4V3HYU0_9MYCO|nr:hypothetical protein [Mycobacteroides salmoniphilum]TDZ80360.1 hypothetical protein DE4586_00295 [Mycobacteroides salmoniphilum]TDZ87258.1 hypothetical protein DE4585_00250 [Mycobacteroides salmoniphilum]TDZ87860.1 hypothetical protein DE4587_00211 [Mycobacteroides salmoniphilum]
MTSESVARFLKAERRSLTVPEEKSVIVEPGDREWSDVTHRLEIAGFDDLQALRLVPERLEERTARQAIAADDIEAREIARRMAEAVAEHSEAQDSCCAPCAGKSDGRASYPARLGQLYREIRPVTHTNLSRAVGDALGVPLEADSLESKITHSFAQRFAAHVTRIPLVVVLFKDIEIGRNATLTLGSKAKSLWANDIRIHSGGRLVITSSYIKIRATSVRGNLA